jgi:hypothetical protein
MGRTLVSSEKDKLVLDPSLEVVARIAKKHGINIWYHDLDNEFEVAFQERCIDKGLFDVFSKIVTGNGETILHSDCHREAEKPSHISSTRPILWKSLSAARVREAYHAHIALALKSDDDGKWPRGVQFPFILGTRMTVAYVIGVFVHLVRNIELPSEEEEKIKEVCAELDKCVPRWRRLGKQEEAVPDLVETGQRRGSLAI